MNVVLVNSQIYSSACRLSTRKASQRTAVAGSRKRFKSDISDTVVWEDENRLKSHTIGMHAKCCTETWASALIFQINHLALFPVTINSSTKRTVQRLSGCEFCVTSFFLGSQYIVSQYFSQNIVKIFGKWTNREITM